MLRNQTQKLELSFDELRPLRTGLPKKHEWNRYFMETQYYDLVPYSWYQFGFVTETNQSYSIQDIANIVPDGTSQIYYIYIGPLIRT